MVSRRDKHCLSASGAEVAEPAQRTTELARRRGLQGLLGQIFGTEGGHSEKGVEGCGRAPQSRFVRL